MRSFILCAAIFSVCLSISLADAQNKVVVIPLKVKSNPSPVAKTGQTICYDPNCVSPVCVEIPCSGTGQDGELREGVAVSPRFRVDGNGTVTDGLTGLIWLRDTNCIKFFASDPSLDNRRSFANALASVKQLATGFCGLTDGSMAGDWRLPNLRELQSLIDYSQSLPSLPAGHPFLNIIFPANDNSQSYYWTSTSYALAPYQVWTVLMADGSTFLGPRNGGYYTLPVR